MQKNSRSAIGLRLLVAGMIACSGVAAIQGPAVAHMPHCVPVQCRDVQVQKDVVFGQGQLLSGPTDLTADVYSPTGRAPRAGRPAVVMLHGGYFTQGDKAEGPLPELATSLAEQGFVVMSVNYRLLTQGPVPSNDAMMEYFKSTPAYQTEQGKQLAPGLMSAIEDALVATTWLGEQEDLNVNPDNISMVGESAGAITALYATYLPNNIGMEAPKVRSLVDLWGGFVATPGQAELIDRGEAPLMVVHGTNDDVLEFDLARSIARRAWQERVPVWYLPKRDGGHGWSQNSLDSQLPSSRMTLGQGIGYFLRWSSRR